MIDLRGVPPPLAPGAHKFHTQTTKRPNAPAPSVRGGGDSRFAEKIKSFIFTKCPGFLLSSFQMGTAACKARLVISVVPDSLKKSLSGKKSSRTTVLLLNPPPHLRVKNFPIFLGGFKIFRKSTNCLGGVSNFSENLPIWPGGGVQNFRQPANLA